MSAVRLLFVAMGVVALAGAAVAGTAPEQQVAVALAGNVPAAGKPLHKVVPPKRVAREIPRSVYVMIDNVTLVSFKKPVATVYVGNPSIAEPTMVDSQHVFVMGKRFGATNLIALGADKTVVVNEPILVNSQHADAVTVFRGGETYNYSCSDFHCETRPVPGDPNIWFDNTEKPAAEHEDASNKAANVSGGSTGSQMH
jgi:hypothetical protein